MADFVTKNVTTLYSPMTELASAIYEYFICNTEITQLQKRAATTAVLPARESCPVCKVPVGFTSATQEVCTNGHVVGMSLLLYILI
jgi:hypothetical protein